MKILFISPIPPGDFSGGEIAVKQSLISLVNLGEITYIGPEFKDQELNSMLDNCIYTFPSPIYKRFLYFLKGITTSYYESLLYGIKSVDISSFDLCFLEFTRYDFVKKLLPERLRFVVRVHNLEVEYFQSKYETDKNIFNLIRFYFSKRQEKRVLNQVSACICLTEIESEKIRKIYNSNIHHSIIPICVKNNDLPIHSVIDNKRVTSLLSTGSLWYGANVDGIIWFIENVLINLPKDKFEYVISGSNPSEKLLNTIKKTTKNCSIRLYENPADMSVYFKKADVFIAPIFIGAGMKVKLAEALSFSLPIVATTHAAIGYRLSKYIRVSDDHKEFLELILSLEHSKESHGMKNDIRKHFELYYSLNSSIKMYKKFIKLNIVLEP